jgi:hypothetical protein
VVALDLGCRVVVGAEMGFPIMSSTPESEHRVRVGRLELVRPGIELLPSTRVDESSELLTPPRPWTSRRGEVVVVAGVGHLADVVTDVGRAVLMALAEDPKAVVCDLSAVTDGSDSDASKLLATAGQQVRDWPAVPVAMLCPKPELRDRLRRAPMSEHVLLRATPRQALAAVDRSVAPDTAQLRLAPSATASRLARDFVSRTCLDWGLAQGIAAACLVVSELVTNGLRHAVTDLDLALARHGDVLRLAVRDRSGEPVQQQVPDVDRAHGRGLALVAACSRAWGVLPAADGGKVVWAVLDV